MLKNFDLRIFIIVISLFINGIIQSQEKKVIEIKQAGSFDKNENVNPGANILRKNKDIRVHLFHEGMNIYSDYALFYKASNSFKAKGNVIIKQG
ncbi:MAG: hypothetical protein CMC53_02765, partial [Flavobacteriaceae bacterium]|nr:hypothetical protein [Flavobacteriaceae bacterium]